MNCWAWNDCDTCPFPDCYEDNPAAVRIFWDTRKVNELVSSGISINHVADMLRKNPRTVRRYLNRK